MLEHGAWRPAAPGDGRTAGFHLSSLYSPVGWFSWADAAEMYEQAQKTPDLMKGFVNTVLGLPFEEEAEAPEWQRLYERRETYRIGIVPESGLFLTAGVDVQKDRIEVEVVAWGLRKESWSVDYRVIEGDTARPEVWAKLDEVLAKDWPHASGHTLPIRVMCVDAGYATQDVYAWVRQHPQASWGPAGAAARPPRTAVAVKGRDRDTALLLSVSKADAGGKRRGLRVWSVGTPVAKGELYRWLKLEWPTEEALEAGASYPPGACHFPQYGEEYFRQLTAERLVTRIVKGFPRGSWEKEPGRRNEALDCRVYARAAAAIYGLDRFEERHWRRMEEALAWTVDRDDGEPIVPRTPGLRPSARQGQRLHGPLTPAPGADKVAQECRCPPERTNMAGSFREAEHTGWTTRAESYDALFTSITDQAIEPILSLLGDLTGRTLLDVCCGPGNLAAEAKARGASATGIDFAETMVGLATTKHPGIPFRVGDAERLPIPEFGGRSRRLCLWPNASGATRCRNRRSLSGAAPRWDLRLHPMGRGRRAGAGRL